LRHRDWEKKKVRKRDEEKRETVRRRDFETKGKENTRL
jgi:hypothetical protein